MKARFSFKRIAIIALVLMILVAATPMPSQAAAPEGCKQTHKVKAGEYLSNIAKLYDTTWQTIAKINQLKDPNFIYVGQVLCVSADGIVVPPTIPVSGVQVYATTVVEDKTVSLSGVKLDAGSRYTVYMSNHKLEAGTRYLAGWVTTDKDGEFAATLAIPRRLIDVSMISIYVVNIKGDSASNWFINATASGAVGGIGTPDITFKINDVKVGEWVKITVEDLPANITFKVYIGLKGTEGANGVLVGLVRSTLGGKATATFQIPENMVNRAKLDILVESGHVEMSAFQTFDNK